MSLYANSSDQYWRERKKTKRTRQYACAALLSFFVLGVLSTVVSRRRSQRKREEADVARRLSLVRPNATEIHHLQCRSGFAKGIQDECTALCIDERMSMPRPTMHQACLHGCHGALVDAVGVSCQGGTEEDTFEKVGPESYQWCSKFLNTLPKPEVLSTCKKSHREGTKRGFRLGESYLNKLLDAEWATRKKLVVTDKGE